MKGGHKKSFSGPKKLSVNKTNPTAGIMKGSGGFTGRTTQPNVKPTTKKTNP